MKLDNLIEVYSTARGVKPEFGKPQVDELLNKTVKELILPDITDILDPEIKKFDSLYSGLLQEVAIFRASIDAQTLDQRNKCEGLKQERSGICAQIAEVYGNGGDGAKLYPRLAKVETELGNIEAFLCEMDRLKHYPKAEKIVAKADETFSAGVKLLQLFYQKFQPAIELLIAQYKNLSLMVKAAESILRQCDFAVSFARVEQIDKVFGYILPNAASMDVDEIRHLARIEIGKALK
jgi:hypothetical protein